jgi:hypothetical protein
MTSANNLNKIILDPTNGFRIQSRYSLSQSFVDRFYVDSGGNLQFSGTLNGANGIFSGTLSAVNGSFTGQLQGASGTFTGTLQAGIVNGGIINGSVVNSAIINGGEVNIGDSQRSLKLYSSGGQGLISLGSGNMTLQGNSDTVVLGSIFGNPYVLLSQGANTVSISGNTVTLQSGNIQLSSSPYVSNEGSYVATRQWVASQGYADSSTLNNYATINYVQSYATKDTYGQGVGFSVSGDRLYVQQYGSTVGYVELK